jgi:predicted transcriptional regulator
MAEGSVRRRRGALEREIVAALASAGRPMTVNAVVAELDGGLAHTTAMTALSRLYAKGVVDREAQGRSYAYTLRVSPESLESDLVANRMRRLLEAEADRALVLARFVAELDPEDGRILTELLGRRSAASPAASDGEGANADSS